MSGWLTFFLTLQSQCQSIAIYHILLHVLSLLPCSVKQCQAYQMHGLNLLATSVGRSTTLKCQDGYRLNPSAKQRYSTQGTTATILCTSDDANYNGFDVLGKLCLEGSQGTYLCVASSSQLHRSTAKTASSCRPLF